MPTRRSAERVIVERSVPGQIPQTEDAAPRGGVRMENPRPHPVQGRHFTTTFRLGGVQFKRIAGVDYIQVTMLTPKTDESWDALGRVAGRVCRIRAEELVDPTLEGMGQEDQAVETANADIAFGGQQFLGQFVTAEDREGDDGIPSPVAENGS